MDQLSTQCFFMPVSGFVFAVLHAPVPTVFFTFIGIGVGLFLT